jgi:hypothetical protein
MPASTSIAVASVPDKTLDVRTLFSWLAMLLVTA